MTTYVIIALLAALVGAVCWLALETRRAHQAIRLYAATVVHYERTLDTFIAGHDEEDA